MHLSPKYTEVSPTAKGKLYPLLQLLTKGADQLTWSSPSTYPHLLPSHAQAMLAITTLGNYQSCQIPEGSILWELSWFLSWGVGATLQGKRQVGLPMVGERKSPLLGSGEVLPSPSPASPCPGQGTHGHNSDTEWHRAGSWWHQPVLASMGPAAWEAPYPSCYLLRLSHARSLKIRPSPGTM